MLLDEHDAHDQRNMLPIHIDTNDTHQIEEQAVRIQEDPVLRRRNGACNVTCSLRCSGTRYSARFSCHTVLQCVPQHV